VTVLDADGSILGTYRKTHIPDGPGYEEKFYFNPGDIGFRVWKTQYAMIRVGICWDQWFPETTRCMALIIRQRLAPLPFPNRPATAQQGAFVWSRNPERGYFDQIRQIIIKIPSSCKDRFQKELEIMGNNKESLFSAELPYESSIVRIRSASNNYNK